jgi:hypothetical protein
MDPIVGPTTMVRHCEDEQAVLLNSVDKRITELPQDTFPNTGPDLRSGFGESCDAVFSPLNLAEEASPQSGCLKFEVSDLAE